MAKIQSPSPAQKSKNGVTVRVRVQIGHHLSSFILLLLLLFHLSSTIATSSPSSIPNYTEHCNSIVPESKSNGVQLLTSTTFFQIRSGSVSGGEKILGPSSESPYTVRSSVRFRNIKIYKTESEGVFKVEGTLIFRTSGNFSGGVVVDRSVFHRVGPRKPRSFRRRGIVSFDLSGFWSVSIGKLCMVGSGFAFSKEGNPIDLSSVFKLNYRKNATIVTSLVTGTVESLDTVDNLSYFDSISIIWFSQEKYAYTLIDQPENSCSDVLNQENSLALGSDEDVCSGMYNFGYDAMELEYNMSNCGDKCNLLIESLGPLGSLPSFMSFNEIQCSDQGKLHLYLGFSNSSYYGYNRPFVPQATLVGEGKWDGAKNQLCLTACKLANFMGSLADTSVGDCSIGLTLSFPPVWSIRKRSSVVGHIWSRKNTKESGYFERIMFRGSNSRLAGLPGLKYEYTVMGNLSCPKTVVKRSGKRYPSGYSNGDMSFDFSLEGIKSKYAWGYAYPLSVDDRFFSVSMGWDTESVVQVPESNNTRFNISYTIVFSAPNDDRWGIFSSTKMSSRSDFKVFAEGRYDAETGHLCMVGCRYLNSSSKKSTNGPDSMDCEISINVQFPPLNPEAGERLKGSIQSKRAKSDPSYFEPLKFTSNGMYFTQAVESIWRMDIEITMVLISLTLACVFIGLQLFYVKKYPDAVPSISLTMLVVLTLGHMIPLVLNFEALFVNDRNRQNVLAGSGGWLEVDEVLVRVFTMVAFILQFRLLQLTWSARLAEGSKMGLWVAEKKALRLCLPLYFLGGLVAWIFHWYTHESVVPLWEELRSYAGLVLDGFLLPQVVLNIFSNSNVKALAPSFYVGNTVVRSLPHAYDAYRSHKYVPHINVSDIYANPNWDFYSTAWDVIIPCGGLLFSILIYLQQRFGGRCVLPPRFREYIEYEKVPVASG
eukprot:TRINITY_DN13064_c0_g1_i1.p1 TRINITY_DN13064_c0_g1~~TRINITY_DN13064_c0_g1_i1.p1  ORF type:complete len:933 (+),score=93.24 TRINITY_DN13064_c0_g1_i1:66-2864(+)